MYWFHKKIRYARQDAEEAPDFTAGPVLGVLRSYYKEHCTWFSISRIVERAQCMFYLALERGGHVFALCIELIDAAAIVKCVSSCPAFRRYYHPSKLPLWEDYSRLFFILPGDLRSLAVLTETQTWHRSVTDELFFSLLCFTPCCWPLHLQLTAWDVYEVWHVFSFMFI